MSFTKVCPLGLCTFEEICPRAPCIECMRRLGQHLTEEMKVIGRQADHARRQGDHASAGILTAILDDASAKLATRENNDVDPCELVSAH